MKLSYTQIEKYTFCPFAWHLHYQEYLRENYVSSSLCFGNAFDAAINELLRTKMKNGITSCNPYKIFDDNFQTAVIGKEVIDLKTSHRVYYIKSDYNDIFFLPEDIKEIKDFLLKNGYENDNPLALRREINQLIENNSFEILDQTDRTLVNLMNYLCLKRKGHLMISSYIEELLPRIKEVISIQEEVGLTNEAGHQFIGKIDFRAILHGIDGIITCDNKTASELYKSKSVLESKQLSIYTEHTGDKKAAYFVVGKKPIKIVEKTCQKCGKITKGGKSKVCQEETDGKKCKGEYKIEEYEKIPTQVIIDEPLEETKQNTFIEIESAMTEILNGNFPQKGLENNKCFAFGKKCPYHDYCRNGDKTGLIDLKE